MLFKRLSAKEEVDVDVAFGSFSVSTSIVSSLEEANAGSPFTITRSSSGKVDVPTIVKSFVVVGFVILSNGVCLEAR